MTVVLIKLFPLYNRKYLFFTGGGCVGKLGKPGKARVVNRCVCKQSSGSRCPDGKIKGKFLTFKLLCLSFELNANCFRFWDGVLGKSAQNILNVLANVPNNYIYIYIYVCVCVHARMCVRFNACECVRVCVCLHIKYILYKRYIYIYIYIYIYYSESQDTLNLQKIMILLNVHIYIYIRARVII